MKRRNWSKSEKLEILKEAKEAGVELTLRKHGIYPSTFYGWRKKYLLEGADGISDTAMRRDQRKYILKLEDELSLAKQLLAERDLEIAMQSELLKKKYPWARKKLS